MKIENEIKKDKIISEVEGLSNKELEKLVSYGLMVTWVIALVAGLGFNSWFVFFIALALTCSYLCKINGINRSVDYSNNHSHRSLFDHNSSAISNSHISKPIGHDWSSATGSNLTNSPSFSSFSGNIYNR